ncbi:hypothetical protein IFT37_15970 [Pseudomonas fluorescens]|uniref:hypothetical protein n=1 Tax=Pseudomonas fluorescens TaxID=294 RepID=UPI001781233C|nr:hypothetical protein [Pseudomonas fluorescens]MBD8746608.1 hypothetical protein [Pseudomonas fluorescens]
MLDQIEYISVSAVTAAMVPLLQRLTFEKRKSKQNALAPPLGTSLGLGVPERRLESVGRRNGPSLAQCG